MTRSEGSQPDSSQNLSDFLPTEFVEQPSPKSAERLNDTQMADGILAVAIEVVEARTNMIGEMQRNFLKRGGVKTIFDRLKGKKPPVSADLVREETMIASTQIYENNPQKQTNHWVSIIEPNTILYVQEKTDMLGRQAKPVVVMYNVTPVGITRSVQKQPREEVIGQELRDLFLAINAYSDALRANMYPGLKPANETIANRLRSGVNNQLGLNQINDNFALAA